MHFSVGTAITARLVPGTLQIRRVVFLRQSWASQARNSLWSGLQPKDRFASL